MPKRKRIMCYWTDGSGRLELELTPYDASMGSHQGACDADIAELRTVPYIAEQLAKWNPAIVRTVLKEYGAWDAGELADQEANLDRMLWIACGDMRKESRNA